jgi:hypothetical protein
MRRKICDGEHMCVLSGGTVVHEEVVLRLRARRGNAGLLDEYGDGELAAAAAQLVLKGALELRQCPDCGVVIMGLPTPAVLDFETDTTQAQESITHCGSRDGVWQVHAETFGWQRLRAYDARHARQLPGPRWDVAVGASV